MVLRPEIQELLNRTALPTDQVRTNKGSKPTSFKIAAVGDLDGPRERFHSSYRCNRERPIVDRFEKVRIEWFSEEPVPETLLTLDGAVVIVHNHLADCPCYTNFGCRRVR